MLARIILPRCARLSSSLITTLNSSFLLYRIIYHATWSVRDIPLQTVAEWLKIVVTMESRLKTYQCRVCVTQFKLVINLCEAPAVIRHPLDTHTHTHTCKELCYHRQPTQCFHKHHMVSLQCGFYF